jgi:hypothetical protein
MLLERLGQMGGCDIWLTGQIRDSPAQLQHPMVGPGSKLVLPHGSFQDFSPDLVQLAVPAHLPWAHLSVQQ